MYLTLKLKSDNRSVDICRNDRCSDGYQSNIMFDGTPCAVKVARTVWSRGKDGDDFKVLPIAIIDTANPPTITRCLRRQRG